MSENVYCDEADLNETVWYLEVSKKAITIELDAASRHLTNRAAVAPMEKQSENQVLRSNNTDLSRDLKKKEVFLVEFRATCSPWN